MKTKTRRNSFSPFVSIFFYGCCLAVCLSCASFVRPVNTNEQITDIKYNFLSATGTLVISDKATRSFATCTTFTFAKNGKKYLFLTAGHCVSNYDKETQKTIPINNVIFIIILEKKDGTRLFYPAKVLESKENGLAIGERKKFEDFAILEAEIDGDIPTVALSKYDPELDEDVRVVTAPTNLESMGLLQLRGYVSKEKIDHKNNATEEKVALEGASGIQVIGLGPVGGFSGGGVLSVKRNAIVGIMVVFTNNSKGHVTFVTVPITKFNSFYEEYMAGKRHIIRSRQIEQKQEKN